MREVNKDRAENGLSPVGTSTALIGTLRSRTGERTTARQRTVRTGPRSPSHAMDKYLKIVVDGDAILLPEYFGDCGLIYSMLNISYRGLESVFFLHLGY